MLSVSYERQEGIIHIKLFQTCMYANWNVHILHNITVWNKCK